MVAVSYLVEGVNDRPIAERLLDFAGATTGMRVEAGGKRKLDPKVAGLRRAARLHHPWLVLRDLDHDEVESCCGPLVESLIGPQGPSPYLLLRLAVRSAEAWLLADGQEFARFFDLPEVRLPTDPDELDHPKQAVVNLCRRSASREVRDGMAPRPQSGRAVGPRYTEFVSEFARTTWSPLSARNHSPSLDRALARLTEAVNAWTAEQPG